MDQALVEASEALNEVRRVAATAGDMLSPRAPLPNHLSRAMQKVADAAQSVEILADFLHRNPNALITGRDAAAAAP
jgi:paraquat-inducible protein B